jgi:divalent metal cation (Fe/Co/Zn/Cd) transporter
MTDALNSETAEKEKRRTARNSVLAAAVLATMKLVVGILTESLGILAQAAHSSLDLAAAIVPLFAVSVFEKPADPAHQNGQGKWLRIDLDNDGVLADVEKTLTIKWKPKQRSL